MGSVKFPASLAAGGVVETSSGNAGLLVGTVEDGATLNVGTLNVPAATVQSASGSAGGVAGLVGSNTGATVNVTEALDLHMLTVRAPPPVAASSVRRPGSRWARTTRSSPVPPTSAMRTAKVPAASSATLVLPARSSLPTTTKSIRARA